MTLGIDVSRLFTEMIMASATTDMVQKKLVYLYLCNYAESHSELTLLAINTLQKNCRDHNPMVRGMALRSMCSLRVENLVEYVLQPLQDGLRDKSAYVRKTAVMGCVKLYYTSESVVNECSIPDTLYAMMRDSDPLVVANCVVALDEILSAEGGVVLTREIAHRLLNDLSAFPAWSQCTILAIVVRYVPSNDDEVFDILNVLDDRLKHPNSGVVLAAAQLFLHFTRNLDDEIKEDVYARLKVPLISKMSAGSAELSFAVLNHLEVLLCRAPALLEDDFASFFCRYNDPGFVKYKKLDLLTTITTAKNITAVVEELAAYVTDVDVDMARRSLAAIGRIGVRHPDSADYVMQMLTLFLDLGTGYITAGTLVELQRMLRRYPALSEEVVPKLSGMADPDVYDSDPEARCALLWMLGRYGSEVDDAPYIVEPMALAVMDEPSAAVKLQLLTTAVQLFFLRPPECQRLLGQLLKTVIDDEVDMNVHDRALTAPCLT